MYDEQSETAETQLVGVGLSRLGGERDVVLGVKPALDRRGLRGV